MVKTRTALTAIFASLAAVLVGGQFAAAEFAQHNLPVNPGGVSTANNSGSSTTTTTPNGTSSSPVGPPTATQSPSSIAAFRDGSVTGQSVNTPYGAVEVKVIVASGSISDVVAVQLTDRGGKSVQISNYAAPILRSEVLQSQSAKVASVSGATYTSFGYLTSLQSALDQLAQ